VIVKQTLSAKFCERLACVSAIGDGELLMKITVIWDVTPSSLVGLCQNFAGTCCLQLEGSSFLVGGMFNDALVSHFI
jgi:hypothetical protein